VDLPWGACDDYKGKPFSYPELVRRIDALLRRSRRRPNLGRLRVDRLEVDPMSRRVLVRGKPVSLSKKERAAARARSRADACFDENQL
jgi:two-component system, OmpR family, phosphate regulon response regulator PhoB